jgi:hypothetical protein
MLIGDVAIVGVPRSISFTRVRARDSNGARLSSNSYVAELANDWIGYLPTRKGTAPRRNIKLETGLHSLRRTRYPGTGERDGG